MFEQFFDPLYWKDLTPLEVIALIRFVLIIAGIFFLGCIVFMMISLIWLINRQTKFRLGKPFVTLAIHIPPEEIRSPKAIENVIAQLYAIKARFNFHDKWILGQYTLQASLELIGQDGYVQFFVHLPRKYLILFQTAVFAQFPEANVEEVEDYTRQIAVKDLVSEDPENGKYDMWGTEFMLTMPSYFPIRTYTLFEYPAEKEFADPLAAIIEMMSHLKNGERFWYQITLVPTRAAWQAEGVKAIKEIVEGKKKSSSGGIGGILLTIPATVIGETFRVFFETITGSHASDVEVKKKQDTMQRILTMVPPDQELIVKAIREKISRLGFKAYARALYIAEKKVFDTRQTTGDFQGIMRQYANPQMNSLSSNRNIEVDYPRYWFPKLREKWRKKRLLRRAKKRYAGSGIDDNSWLATTEASTRNILSVEEIAGLWHFPLQEHADKIGVIKRVMSKRVNPKQLVPEASEDEDTASGESQCESSFNPDVTFFARTNFRNLNRKFGIRREDRRRHFYVIGKTGMGKTTLLENMIYQDIARGEGVAVIDPHGDLTEAIIDLIPASRINDVVYFNPADQDYPIAFNILSQDDSGHRFLIASSLVGIFKKIWADSWGPRLEYLLRNSLLTLLEVEGNTILGVTRIFVDKEYRAKLIEQVRDPVLKHFWLNEYAKYNQNFQVEAVAPIQNKLGQFISIPLIRNMIGQVKSKINFREIIDGKKILLVNLAKGLIGEDVSALLGATIISKLQIAAMMRADITEEERHDFYLYIDEFQNFSTDSFATILSEARKYRLNLIMAHQYIQQLDEVVAAAVFGNVGTMVTFGIGADDAESLELEFTPEFIQQDLVNLGKYEVILRLMINGATSRPFSATTLSPLGAREVSSRDKIIRASRERYSSSREEVEEKLIRWHVPAFDDRPRQQLEEPRREDGATPMRNKKEPAVIYQRQAEPDPEVLKKYQYKSPGDVFKEKERKRSGAGTQISPVFPSAVVQAKPPKSVSRTTLEDIDLSIKKEPSKRPPVATFIIRRRRSIHRRKSYSIVKEYQHVRPSGDALIWTYKISRILKNF